jgi:hypothetical protein
MWAIALACPFALLLLTVTPLFWLLLLEGASFGWIPFLSDLSFRPQLVDWSPSLMFPCFQTAPSGSLSPLSKWVSTLPIFVPSLVMRFILSSSLGQWRP